MIQSYVDDLPFPSVLIADVDDDPVHVVVGYDKADKEVHFITAYRPDLEHFEEDYKAREGHQEISVTRWPDAVA